MLNFCGIVVAILKMETGRNFTMSGINSGRLNRPMLNLWGIVAAILKMATGRNFSMPGIISRHHNLPTYEIGQCWICAVLWWPFWKWRPVEICQCRDIIIYPHIKSWWYRTMLNFCGIVAAILKIATGHKFSMSGINSGHHYLPRYKILMISDNMEFLPPIFYAVFWQPFWKWQTSWQFWKHRVAPLMVTYHYVKFYVSIIIHLEVININVRNFNFPIGFYSNSHPLWTPQLRLN